MLCSKCGRAEIDYGRLSIIGGLYTGECEVQFRSLKRKTERVWVHASACPNCGYMEMYLEPKNLKEGIKEKSFFSNIFNKFK